MNLKLKVKVFSNAHRINMKISPLLKTLRLVY